MPSPPSEPTVSRPCPWCGRPAKRYLTRQRVCGTYCRECTTAQRALTDHFIDQGRPVSIYGNRDWRRQTRLVA